VRYSITSPVIKQVDLGADLSVNFAKEFGGNFEEEFTYYGAGFRIGYQFHKYWRADLGYEFRLKESNLASRDFHRNRVTLALAYSF
jgi:maltoporin